VSNTYAHADLKPPGACLKLGHAAALVLPAALWARVLLRLGSTYGPSALLASPAVGWLPFLGAAWLQLSWRQRAAAAPAAAAGSADAASQLR
jgi:hypothetical protein